MNKKNVISILAIVIILGVVYFSQKSGSLSKGSTLISGATSKTQDYVANGSNWVMSNIYPKITGEVQFLL